MWILQQSSFCYAEKEYEKEIRIRNETTKNEKELYNGVNFWIRATLQTEMAQLLDEIENNKLNNSCNIFVIKLNF